MNRKHNVQDFGSLATKQLQIKKQQLVGHQNPQSTQYSLQTNRHPRLQNDFIVQISLSEINRKQYVVNSNLLLGSSISELMRAKLRAWIYEECAAKYISRRTSCLAVTFIDLYLMKGGNVTTLNFQALGLSLLLLANKLTDRRVIEVNPAIFLPSQIFNFQKDFCYRIRYNLNPLTYVNMIDQILHAWNLFALKQTDLWFYSGISSKKYESCDLSVKQMDPRYYYELADTVYLVLKTNNYKLDAIIFYILKAGLSRDYQLFCQKTISIEDQVVISFWRNLQQPKLVFESFDQIFEAFTKRIGYSNFPKSYDQAEQYLKIFIEQDFNATNSPSQNSFNLQTYNKNGYTVSKKIIKGLRTNNRKSSSETTF